MGYLFLIWAGLKTYVYTRLGNNAVTLANKLHDISAKVAAQKIITALEAYYAYHAVYPPTLETLITSGDLVAIPTDPTVEMRFTYTTSNPNHSYLLCVTYDTTGKICSTEPTPVP